MENPKFYPKHAETPQLIVTVTNLGGGNNVVDQCHKNPGMGLFSPFATLRIKVPLQAFSTAKARMNRFVRKSQNTPNDVCLDKDVLLGSRKQNNNI